MEITYRKATIVDLEDLIKMRIKFLNEVQSEIQNRDEILLAVELKTYFQKVIPKDEFVAWLAFDKEKIIATSGLVFHQIAPTFTIKKGKIAYIINIFTLKNYRGKGIGKEIFNLILQEAIKRGYKRITLHASEDGRKVYEKFGFKAVDDEMVLDV